MRVIEIVSGVVLLLSCILIIVAVSLQSGRGSGMSGVIMGGEGNASVKGRTKDIDAKLATITKVLAVVLFVVTLAVNIISLATSK
ncbi:MAG: preprotein translocase subunit SecG [Oscillospiraceae bacterium]